MLSARRVVGIAALLLIGLFVYGVVRLLAFRYAAGDVFPPYSTLRADPLGTQVFYESLRALDDRRVERSERDLDQVLGSGEGTALLVLGVSKAHVSEKERAAMERFVHTGGRLVVTFVSRYEREGRSSPSPTPAGTPRPSPSPERSATPRGISLEQVFHDVKLTLDRDDEDNVASRGEGVPLEESLRWHSGIVLQPQNDAWRVIYERERGPVMIERTVGAGSVVLAGDSYFVSNEALLRERAPALLAWLVGSAQHVIFDETHLDVRAAPGIVTLLRRYGLGGFIAGLAIFVGLWAWKNSTSALAPRRTAATDEIVTGRDSFAGFVQLLRRGLPRQQLLEACVSEWEKSAGASRAGTGSDGEAVRAARGEKEDPVAAYNRIVELVESRKWKISSSN